MTTKEQERKGMGEDEKEILSCSNTRNNEEDYC